MSDRPAQLENHAFRIPDCQIWAEIYYLDSPTNYREYLDQIPLQPSMPRSDFRTLDGSPPGRRDRTKLWLILMGLLMFVGTGTFLYLIMEAF